MSQPACVIQALLLVGMSGVNPICLKAHAQASATGPLSSSTSSSVADWPQWRGPNRDGLSPATGLLKRWPAEGPPVAWIARDLGGGYGEPSAANGRVYCLGDRGDRNTFHPRECLSALEESTGNLLWRTQVGQTNASFLPEGSSSTPTVDGDHVYALGARGDLVCADVTTGVVIWKLNLVSDFGGGVPGYSYCESPLVDEDKVVVTPGGGTATIVALDKNRGTELWRCGVPGTRSDQYSSVIAATVDGKRVYVQNLDTAAVGIGAEDGKLLWSYKTGGRVIPTAICQSNLVFVPDRSSFALLRQSRAGMSVRCQIVRTNWPAYPDFQSLLLLDGYLYGPHNYSLGCSDFATGKLKWQVASAPVMGYGSVVAAEGRLYYRGQLADMYLVEANPKARVMCGDFQQPERSGSSTCAPPVIANRRLYLRDQDLLLCFDIAEKERRPLKLLTCVPPTPNAGVKLLVGACDGAPLVSGEMGKLDILVTSDLRSDVTNWSVLKTAPQLTNGLVNISDSSAIGVLSRFYIVREW